MAPDPFPLHHSASDLEASTAMTSVTSDAMEHAAKQAAELVEEAAHKSQTAASRGRRTGRKAAETPQRPENTTAVEPAMPDAGAADARDTDQSFGAAEQATSDDGAAVSPPRSTADDTAARVEDGGSQPAETLARFNAKAAEAMRTNVDAAFAFWTSMMSARSLSEAASLNAQHLRRQVETLTAQSRELSALAQQLAVESLDRFRTSSDRSK